MHRLIVFGISLNSVKKNKLKKLLPMVLYIALAFVLIIFSIRLHEALNKKMYPLEYFDLISEYSERYSLSPELICSVILCESGFDANAVSKAGACGLMQLLPSTFDWVRERYALDAEDIFEPKSNICVGCAYLSYLTQKFQGTEAVLAAYNAGEGRVCEWLNDARYSTDGITLLRIPYPETEEYINRVCNAMLHYPLIYDEFEK